MHNEANVIKSFVFAAFQAVIVGITIYWWLGVCQVKRRRAFAIKQVLLSLFVEASAQVKRGDVI